MNPSPRIHRVAAVLLVVFLLTTVWAAYYLYATTHPASTTSGSTGVASYSEIGANSFVAAVLPSELYNNATTVYGGNVTLFTPITKWINVSLVYFVTTNRSASISLNETFTVNLSTSAWSKTLYATTNSTANPATTAAGLVTHYDVNVSGIVALAAQIAQQVGYPSVDYTLSFQPSITGDVVAAGVRAPISSEPLLNLSFSGSLVRPDGLSYRHAGTLSVTTTPPGPDRSGSTVATLALVASVGAFGGSTYVATRRSRPEPLPPLAELLAPYAEAIAETGPLPGGTVIVPVSQLPDLVKVADTLGKPILRPSVGPSEPPEVVVIDGGIAYRYRHVPSPEPVAAPLPTPPTAVAPPTVPPSVAAPALAPAPVSPAVPAPRAPPTAAVGPAVPAAASPLPSPPASEAPPAVYVPDLSELEPARRPTPTGSALLRRLRTQTGRLRVVRLDPWIRSVAVGLAHRAVELLRANEIAEAEKVIDGLERLITDGSRSAGASRGNAPGTN